MHDADTHHSESGNKMVSEIYLTRLLATKVCFGSGWLCLVC